MVTITEQRNFFAGHHGDQGSDQPPLLPTKSKDGAPRGNLWLLNMVEGEVEVRYAKSDNHPYVSYRAEVMEPSDYEGRALFGMFFFPRPVDLDGYGTEKELTAAIESYDRQLGRVIGQIDGILGADTVANTEGDTLEEVLHNVASLLQNTAFVGKVGIERGKKVDPTDEAEDAERYPDRNRIMFFYPADTWESTR